MTEEYWDSMDTYIDNVTINFPQRSIKLIDSTGKEEDLKFPFSYWGAEGFMESVNMIQETIDPTNRHYIL